jgi:predicted N-acetyltransferase YhbS
MKPEILTVRANEVNDENFWISIARLRDSVWIPQEPAPIEERARLIRQRSQEDDSELFTIWENETAIAHARLFAREITTQRGALTTGALAAVCSAPSHRGQGLGRLVVEAAFARVHDGTFPVILFQTGVPEFYAKLGARNVSNRFVDSTSETDANPWWQEDIMIYPAAFAWPDGNIDLNGPGW